VTNVTLQKCKAALKKLRAYRPPESPRLKRRVWTASALGRLISLAGAFTSALAEAGAWDELARRAQAFADQTGPGSGLDQAREAVLHLLTAAQEPQLYIPDLSAKPLGPGRRVFNEDWIVTVELQYPNYVGTIADRLADRDFPWREMATALDGAKRLLGLEVADAPAGVIRRWHQELWTFHLRCEREHLLGSWLLERCHDAVDPTRARAEEHEALRGILPGHGDCLVEALKNAAEALYDFAEGSAQGGSPNAVPGQANTPAPGTQEGTWFHGEAEKVPNEYAHGPVIGSLKELARMICPSFGYKADRRGVIRLASSGQIWVQKISGQSYKVFFKEKNEYAEARTEELRIQQERKQRQAKRQQP
jgi:hypothetical protein